MKQSKIISSFLGSLIGLGFVILLSYWASTASAQPSITRQLTERDDGGYYRIIDEQNKVIDYTSRYLSKGDQFINADNMRYQITSIEGDYAHAQLVRKETEAKMDLSSTTTSTQSSLLAQKEAPSIGIYHTHSAESYVPTDGTESDVSNGGIIKVGKVLEDKLDDMGFAVHHSERLHHPHDINAYYRSRRTAVELLQKDLNALFDVHRDAVPPEVYHTNIDGQDVTKVKFVVGNTNPRYQSNLEFAKQLKSAADEKYPGIVQGILIISSDFNQDLAQRCLLVEVGAHTNSREEAERGIAMFATALPAVLGSPGGPPAPPQPEESSGAWKAAILIIVLVAAAVFGYLYMNTGSVEGAVNQLRDFISRIPLKRKD